MSRHVLITGASGFIGRPVAAAIAGEGWTAIGFDIAAAGPSDGDFDIVRGDVTDAHQIYRVLREHAIDTIVHTGGFSGPMLERDNPYRVCHTNVVGTLNLLEAARVTGIKRFVFLSSAHAYGDTPPAPVSEDAPFKTRDIYGASKASSDLLLRAYREQHGLDAVALRISNGYGPGRTTSEVIRTMLEDAIARRPTKLAFGGSYGRTFLYVKDAVNAVIAAIKSPSPAQAAYNITGSEFVQIEYVAGIVRKLFADAAITLADGVDPLGYRREQLDISAARRDLGWSPAWTLERGIPDYARWLANPVPKHSVG
jgi:nucleoside-diphosphate-sugar epimerase